MYDFQAEIETTEHFFFCFNLYSLRGSELFDEPEKVYSNFLTLNASAFCLFVCLFFCFCYIVQEETISKLSIEISKFQSTDQ